MKKTIDKMTRKDFMAVPFRKSFKDDFGEFEAFILIPNRRKHDSGWGCAELVAIRGGEPFVRFWGGDDLSLNGDGWRVDILHKSQLCRFRRSRHTLKADHDCDSMEIYGERIR